MKSNELNIIAPSEPINVSFSASNPLPFNKYLCPGKTPNAWAESGAPKKIEGIESKNVWVIDIAIIKTINE